ncbi:MAG: LCP family protein [Sciscionella sp.]
MSGARLTGKVGKVLLAVLSAAVLVLTGAGWTTIHQLSSGLSTADVLDSHSAAATGPQNILLVGIDTRTDAQGNPLPAKLLSRLHAGSSSDGGDSTDTMMIVHIPAGGGKATAISIPRDSYVQIAGGYGKHKINSAYSYAQLATRKTLSAQGVRGPQLATESAQAGARNSIKTVERLTGLTITHFASVNLIGFYDISNAIGGVQVCLKAPSHDPVTGATFPGGVQTISGAKALSFVRQRHGLPLGDLDRIKRQQTFLAAVAKKVLSAGTLTDPNALHRLIGAIQRTVTLDQNWDLLGFAQQLQGLTGGNIHFVTIPIVKLTYPTPSDGDAVKVDPNAVKAFVNAKTSATRPPNPDLTSASKAPGNSATTVDVRNDSGRTGLAARTEHTLRGKGYTAGSTGNGSARQSSTVSYASGSRTAAKKIADGLGGGLSIQLDSSLRPGHVQLDLGSGYRPASTGSSVTTSTTTGSATSTPPITAGGTNCIN